MKAVLDVDGWRKIEDVDPTSLDRGWVDIAICRPLSFSAKSEDLELLEDGYYRVRLRYAGELKISKLPFFEYKE